MIPSPRVLAAIDNQAARRDAEKARRDAENARERNKITAALAKAGMAATAIALALGLFGDKLDTKAASGKVIIYNTDPNSVTEQICGKQKSLEEELGLSTEGSTSSKNDFWNGCRGTARSVIGEVERGSEVRVTVTKDALGEVAVAKVSDNKNS
mgnify:CR=1 FL=1